CNDATGLTPDETGSADPSLCIGAIGSWEAMLESGPRHSGVSALERVRAVRPSLRKSEAKVADRVLADPGRILESSLAEAATLAGVSQPTVIRLCVAAGFSGYQELKLRLAQR